MPCEADCSGKCPGAADGCGGVCNSNDCPGCCDGDACKGGADDSACGIGGAFCQDCSAAAGTCGDGRCDSTTKCTAQSCPNGCCDGDACKAGTANAACGTGGQACAQCATDQVCKTGQCDAKVVCQPSCKGKCPGASDGCGGTCVANDCNGCCHGSSCYSGATVFNCGASGGICERCDTNETCASGTCTPKCTPDCSGKCSGASDGCGGVCTTNGCGGCCQGKVCFAGNTSSYCGKSGAACDSCASYEYCSSASGCTVSTVAKWDLVIESASLSSSKAWDDYATTSRLPDVRVRFPNLTLSGSIVETTTQWNNYTPQWNSAFGPFYTYQLDKAHIVEIVDYDTPTSSDIIGRCAVTITKATLVLGSKTVYTCTNPDDGKDYLLQLKLGFKAR